MHCGPNREAGPSKRVWCLLIRPEFPKVGLSDSSGRQVEVAENPVFRALWRRERTTLQIGDVNGADNRDWERTHIHCTECEVLPKVIDQHDVAARIAKL